MEKTKALFSKPTGKILLAAVFVFVGLCFARNTALAASANSATSTVATVSTSTSDGTIQWATINNATTTGAAFATFVGSGTATTTYLRISNLGFSIPAGQTITGVSFSNSRKVGSGNNGNAVDKAVMLVDDTGTIVGNNQASAAIWPLTTPTTVAYGGDGNTWGVTLTQAQVNSPNFGIVMSAGGAAAGFNRTASTNSWGVSIWYTTSTVHAAPTLTSISPTSTNFGGGDFTLNLTGTGFDTSSTVQWNGSGRTTAFLSNTQLTATILAADISAAGTDSVTVTNPTPGGGTSGAQTFTVNHASPTTTSISPTSVTAGGAGFSLVVNGTGFDASSTVQIGGVSRVTTFASSTQLAAAILASDISSAGSRSITVVNPTPGGGTSNAQTLTVSSAPVAPSIQSFSVSPLSVTIGGSQIITFTWSSSGTATITCVIKDPGNTTVASNGASGTATTTQPQATSIYTLTCTNSAGSANATVTITASSGITPSTGGGALPTVSSDAFANAHFYGYTFPGADIQVFSKSSATGPYAGVPFKTVNIAGDGSFVVSIANFLQADHFFSVQVKDKNGNSTAVVSFSQFSVAGSDLIVKDIIIPPTLSLNPTVVVAGNPIQLSGYAIPGAAVNLFIDGKSAGTTEPNSAGFYSFAATSTGISLGSHSAQAKEVFSGKTSDSSLQKAFILTTKGNSIVDLNGDQSATIADWSIFLSRWRSADKGILETIDLNHDGKVDIKDFSIFLNAFQQAKNSQ